GTRAFVAGEETFAHSLAVAERGQVIAAVVLLPAMARLYSASATEPAQCNGVLIHTSQPTDLAQASVLTAKASLDPGHWPRGVPTFHRSFRASLAYRLCLVAEGRHDAMLTLRDSWEWDIAAGALIATRAGARVTDKTGLPLSFNAARPLANGVIVASTDLHAQISGHLKA
ncbi:MAG: inositol monophosphatase family protein, partial [Novosphingobium sp.]